MRTVLCAAIGVALVGIWAAGALAEPFAVGPVPKEPAWTTWGYQVDGQTWANWFAVSIPWGTEEEMSGIYVIDEDFLFRVDPDTSGLEDPEAVYGNLWWNHDDVHGLGEFFDAGSQASDRYYAFELSLGQTDTWSVFYESPRDLTYVESTVTGEHRIFEGTVVTYWNRDGYFYGILAEGDGRYNGYFTPSVNDGQPLLVNSGFHAGYGDPVPEPAAVALVILGGMVAAARKVRAGR